MKKTILNRLTALITSGSMEEKVNLQAQVSHLIENASFDLPANEANSLKDKIINSLTAFVDAPNKLLYNELSGYMVVIDTAIVE